MPEYYEVVLPNGSKVAVDYRTYRAINALKEIELELANGRLSAFALARVRVDSQKPQGMVNYNDPEALRAIRRAMHELGDHADRQAAQWEGTAPLSNRSWATN